MKIFYNQVIKKEFSPKTYLHPDRMIIFICYTYIIHENFHAVNNKNDIFHVFFRGAYECQRKNPQLS